MQHFLDVEGARLEVVVSHDVERRVTCPCIPRCRYVYVLSERTKSPLFDGGGGMRWDTDTKSGFEPCARSRFISGIDEAGGTGIEPATCGFGVRWSQIPLDFRTERPERL